MSWCFF